MLEQSELPQQKRNPLYNKIKRKESNTMIHKPLTSKERPIFPKRAIVTAGMPYGNKDLHFGHVGGMFIHADIFARFLRDRIGKENVIFLSGTDCYGSPIMESYAKLQEEGYKGTLKDYVTKKHQHQKETLKHYDICLDFFGGSALGEASLIHENLSKEIFQTLYRNGYIKKMSIPQFYDEEKKLFLNGRQVLGKCPIPGCNSQKAYADECSLGHQFLPSELIHPTSCLSKKTPILKNVENWYFDLESCIDVVKDHNDFLRDSTNTRKYQLETVEEFLKKPLIYVSKKYITDLVSLRDLLPNHTIIDDKKKASIIFEFKNLLDRDDAKNILESQNIHYTSGKTLVPFRLSSNVSWGVPFPEYDNLKNLTFWVWPESLWAPISFFLSYLKEHHREQERDDWLCDTESEIYQFIGEDNIYFYSIAQTGLFYGLQVPKGQTLDKKKIHLSHIIANRHLLYMDTKASSSSDIKPPMADELLHYYTKDQLRMHFMSLGLSSKSVSFKPQVFFKKEERVGGDPVLKEGNLITNVFNRLIRTCFYVIQNNYDGKLPDGEVTAQIRLMSEKTVLLYERHMYDHEFHRISYVLDDFIRFTNKYWVNNVKIADATKDSPFKKQLVIDCFYACKIMAILIHPIAPDGCEMFREYLNLGEELWNWNTILEPISFYISDLEHHKFKYLKPRMDFFQKHECQLKES